jgi:hypothetical protein
MELVGRFMDTCIPPKKNNVAKKPAETLLLNIGNGVFCFGRNGE